MAMAHRRSPRKYKCTKGNAGADVMNRTSSTDVDAKVKMLEEMTIAGYEKKMLHC